MRDNDMVISYKRTVCFLSTPICNGRLVGFHNCRGWKCARWANVKLGIDTLIANSLVY